jgi:hypothetical protein
MLFEFTSSIGEDIVENGKIKNIRHEIGDILDISEDRYLILKPYGHIVEKPIVEKDEIKEPEDSYNDKQVKTYKKKKG